MALTSLVMRISGVAAYSDGSHEPFEVSLHRDLISNPPAAGLLEAFARVMADSTGSAAVDAVLAFLPTDSATLALSPDAPSTSKTVSDITFFMTAHISEDDGTNSSFAIEYFKEELNHYSSATTAVWNKIAADTSLGAPDDVVSVFEKLAGSGNVTFA